MIKFTFLLLALLGGFLLYHFFQVQRKIQISKELVQETKPFQLESSDLSQSLLVLGDSTAYGVGASNPEGSFPALYSNLIGATSVENKGVSGAKIADVQNQLQSVSQKEYVNILLQIGANNIVAYESVGDAEKELRAILQALPPHQNLTVLICGNVGSAKLIPWFLRGLYTKKTLEYHALYERVVPEFGGTYVNLYIPKSQDPFVQQPGIYLAKDEFHPSSAGYQLWIEQVKKSQDKK